MSRVNRYYISKEHTAVGDIIIRDRVAPCADDTYPIDIAVTVTKCNFPSLAKATEIANKICELLNEEL